MLGVHDEIAFAQGGAVEPDHTPPETRMAGAQPAAVKKFVGSQYRQFKCTRNKSTGKRRAEGLDIQKVMLLE
jgi:hypothetical protein